MKWLTYGFQRKLNVKMFNHLYATSRCVMEGNLGRWNTWLRSVILVPSNIVSKPFIKFMKATDSPTENKADKAETVRKTTVKYAELYRKTSNKSNVRGNISYLSDYEPFDRAYVSFGQGGCKITGKGTIKTSKLEFENVYFVKDLKFTWTFFLKTKDETSGILRKFITEIENLKEIRVKIIRCDNRGEFRNKEINDFCSRKGIKREFSNARTPQHNGVAERRNRTLIEAARTMLADAKLPVTFWAEAVNTACYVQNKVLVSKSQNKTPYELFNGRPSAIGFLKPFGCYVMILKTLDNLGKFKAKGDEGYFIGYSMSSKAFRVFNKRTKRVEENLYVDFLENTPIKKGAGPNWLFDIDSLTNFMNYVPVVVADTNSTNFLGIKEAAGQDVKKDVSSLRYIALPNWFHEAHLESSTSNAQDTCSADAPESSGNSNLTTTSTNPPGDHIEILAVKTPIPTVSSPVPTACLDISSEPSSDTRLISKKVTSQDDTPSLDNLLTLTNMFEDILGVTTNTDDTNGVEADLGNMETTITASPTLTLRIHKDHPKKEGIDYDEVFAPVVRIEAIRLFVAYASFMRFTVYQMDVKSAFLYGTINEEVEFEALMHEKFQMSAIDKENPWGKDGTGKDVDLHLYRSMIGSLMYLTASRPNIMFAVCACARHQVTPKECHLHAVKRIFRYLNGHPKLGLWYPKESPFDLVAYSDSYYGGATQDRKSTTRGCQFLGRRLISWQCKKQIIVATSTTEAEYVAAASGCRQVMLSMPCEGLSKEISSSILLLIETTKEGTKILATVDGKLRTVSESSIRRNLKLNDEAGISSLPDAELFENLTLMGYNISPNQKFTFQKGQFSHQWKYLIHTIMQCLSPKSTRKIFTTLRVNSPSFSGRTVPLFPSMLVTMGEGFGTLTEPYHTPSPEAQQTSPTTHSSPSLPPSSALPTAADEPASPLGDGSQGEAFPTVTGLVAGHDRANIAKNSTLPSDSTPRVTSLAADEGSMQHQIQEFAALCTSLQRQHTEMASKIEAQELEITNLKARVKLLEDREGGGIAQFRDDTPIKGRSLDEGEEAAKKGSDDTAEMVTVLTSLDAPTVLSSEVAEVPTGSGSIPTSGPPATGIPTGSDVVPTSSPIFTTAIESTPYTRRKGKEKMVESNTAKKKKLQEHIDVQVARELEEEMARDMMIDGLDRNNETVAKYQQEYHQFAAELPIGRGIELISDLVKYQDNYAKVLKFQNQQRKSLSRKQQRDFYMSVLKSQADFIPIGSKEEAKRFKRKGLRLEQDSTKKVKTTEEVPKEKLKEMMQLIPVEEHLDREDLNQLWALVKETLNIRPAVNDKEKELWVELKRLNKIHKAFPLLVKSSHCQKKFLLLVRKVPPAEDKRCHCQEDCTAIEDREFRKDSYCRIMYRTPCPIKGVLSLNSKITDLSEKLGDMENMLYHYKLGLSQVEARIVKFKNQEIEFCEKIRGLEFKVECRTDRIKSLTKELEELKKEKEGLDTKLTGFQTAFKDLDNLLESQRTYKNKEGLPEFADDTITDYSRPSPAIESNSDDLQNRNSPNTETGESSSTILSKLAIKFVKSTEKPTKTKTDKVETAKKYVVKYAKMYRRTSKRSNVKGNQRNWNNMKSQQLGKNFLMKNKACYNCGCFDYLSYEYGKWVEQGRSCSKNNNTQKSMPSRDVFHKTGRSPTRINRPNMNSVRPRTTQDLMIILIHRVKRLERELKERTPQTKIHKDDVKGRSRKRKSMSGGVEQEEAFQNLKSNLYDAPILPLPDGVEDFVVYCDASNQGLGCVLMQRGKTVIYTDHKSLQHIFDQNKLNMHQRMWIELFSDHECEIHYHPGKANVVADALTQSEAFKKENIFAKRLHGLDQQMERKEDESLYFMDRIWVLLVRGVRTIIMDEAHKTSKFLTCSKVKAEHLRPSGLLQHPEIPE
nr:retrovirus-related Pol polyprotein from transposon TNT 1-94 [Tanacetum cinerariifolium]